MSTNITSTKTLARASNSNWMTAGILHEFLFHERKFQEENFMKTNFRKFFFHEIENFRKIYRFQEMENSMKKILHD